MCVCVDTLTNGHSYLMDMVRVRVKSRVGRAADLRTSKGVSPPAAR